MNGTTKLVVVSLVPNPFSDFVVSRLNLDGSFDTSFGSGGSVILGSQAVNFVGGKLAIQPDGKIILAGASAGTSGTRQGAVARFNLNGSLDSTFNPNGPTRASMVISGTGGGIFWNGAVQPDGKIVGAGNLATISGSYQMLLTP